MAQNATVSIGISIHALREEGDESQLVSVLTIGDFYPRPPRGGRPFLSEHIANRRDFYPRPPRGGRRCGIQSIFVALIFLSTPSARRATCKCIDGLQKISNFYPRPPRGGRLLQPGLHHERPGISIHALREEGDN